MAVTQCWPLHSAVSCLAILIQCLHFCSATKWLISSSTLLHFYCDKQVQNKSPCMWAAPNTTTQASRDTALGFILLHMRERTWKIPNRWGIYLSFLEKVILDIAEKSHSVFINLRQYFIQALTGQSYLRNSSCYGGNAPLIPSSCSQHPLGTSVLFCHNKQPEQRPQTGSVRWQAGRV